MFQIKICGVTTADDARMVVAAGADAIGFNFYSKSARYLSRREASDVAEAVPSTVAKVGVFVNESPESMRRIGDELRLDYLQLHGDEPVECLEQLAPRRLIRAFRCPDATMAPLLEYLAECSRRQVDLAAVLIDAHVPGAYGGTGRRVDWAAVDDLRARIGQTRIILAGGLTAENVGQAIRSARPQGVDTASGVESAPGRKDAGKVAAFVQAARAALAALEAADD